MFEMRSFISVQLAVFLLALSNGITGQKLDALIDTGNDQLGKIQGSYAWAMKNLGEVGRKYYWFTGIPYAKVESYTGANRFKPPKLWDGPLSPIDEIFPADERKSQIFCPQDAILDLNIESSLNTALNVSTVQPLSLLQSYYSREGKARKRGANLQHWGMEDCLIVTVNTPHLPKKGESKLLPVIFFIHGGGFDAFWGSVFGGQRLLNHDVVLVTMNYRLGVLGSLNLGIPEAPGNAAVYDCITALEWVKKYIHLFGGDKNSVTLSGQSAGAVLATTVFLSPLAKGLFHRVIGDSGSALSVWANQKNPIEENLKVAQCTKCKTLVPPSVEQLDNTKAKEIVECIRGLDFHELLNARNEYGAKENAIARLGYDAFVPSVQSSAVEPLVPRALNETPAETLKHMRQNNASLMMGATRHDGSFVFEGTFYDFLVANGLNSDPVFIRNELLPAFMKGVGLEDPTGALLHAFQKAYLGEAANSDDIVSKFPGLLDIHTAVGFKAGAYNLVEAHSKMNPHSYYYAFDYRGLFTTYDIANGKSEIPGGIAHVDDLLYLFQLIPLLNSRDWSVADRYVNYWVNFAIYGNPNGPGDLDEPFPRYNAADHRFLIINGTDKIGYNCRDTWFGNANELWK